MKRTFAGFCRLPLHRAQINFLIIPLDYYDDDNGERGGFQATTQKLSEFRQEESQITFHSIQILITRVKSRAIDKEE